MATTIVYRIVRTLVDGRTQYLNRYKSVNIFVHVISDPGEGRWVGEHWCDVRTCVSMIDHR